jgi:hypothetical protein
MPLPLPRLVRMDPLSSRIRIQYISVYAVSIRISKARPFHYPSPRAINLSVAKALPKSLIIAHTPLIIHFATKFSQQEQTDITPLSLSLSHLALPILLQIGKRFYRDTSGQVTVGQILFETREMKHLSSFFTLVLLFASPSHLVLVCNTWAIYISNCQIWQWFHLSTGCSLDVWL